ncbi:MAG: hypothetical protein DDT30_01171 [Dehalococcoidia bacterium]|nr:hypothetical protein [Bacillota bacterium]MBT9142646.1 hypothetical protein [Bacillota bacterium]
MLAADRRLAKFALNPLPPLLALIGIGVNDKMLVDRFGNLMLDLAPYGVVGDVAVRPITNKGNHAPLLGDRLQGKSMVVKRNFEGLSMPVPAQFVDEQGLEVKCAETLPRACNVDGHWWIPPHSDFTPFGQRISVPLSK